MALLKIKNNSGILVGELELSREGVRWTGLSNDPDFYAMVEQAVRRGIPFFTEAFDDAAKAFVTRKSEVFPGEPLFEVACRNFLTRAGFLIFERDDTLERKITELLDPHDPETTELLRKVLNMSHLEQSLLLLALEKESAT